MKTYDIWRAMHQIHDEVSLSGDDIVWARGSDGVVHFWYKMPAGVGFASCGVSREDIQQFFITEVDVTCLGCLATKDSPLEGAFDEIEMYQYQKDTMRVTFKIKP